MENWSQNQKFAAIASVLVAVLMACLCIAAFAGILVFSYARELEGIQASTGDTVFISPVFQDGQTIHVSSTETVIIELWWGGSTEAITESSANDMLYTIYVDGQTVDDLDNYRNPAYYVLNGIQVDGETVDAWYILWDYPLYNLSPGRHVIEVDWLITADMSDGWETFEAGDLTTWQVIIESHAP